MLGLILADNLGMHEILGFSKSFVSNYSCRFCKIHRNDMHISTKENISLIRTKEQYEHDVILNEVSETGIKHVCVFNQLPSFHAVTNYSVDIMHDLYEGVCHYNLANILNHFIFEKNYFSLNEFNDKKSMFNYGPIDIGNISQPILIDHIKRARFNTSASEMRCLFNFFTLFIGDKVPSKDPVWHFLTNFIQILDIDTNTHCSLESLEKLSRLIKEHHGFYVNYFK